MSPPFALPPPSAELLALVAAGGAVRARRPGRQLAALIVASLVCGTLLVAGPAAWIWGCSLRPDLSFLPLPWVIGGGTAWLVAFVAMALLALLPVRGQMLPRLRSIRWITLAAPLALALMSLVSPVVPGHGLIAQDATTALLAATQCLAAALVVAVCPVLIGLWALRRAIALGAGWVAAGLGACGAALGGAFLHLHCPWAAPSHVIVGHVLPVALGAALTAWWGRRVLEPR